MNGYNNNLVNSHLVRNYNIFTYLKELMEDAGLKEPKFQYDKFFEASFLKPSYYDKDYGTYDLTN